MSLAQSAGELIAVEIRPPLRTVAAATDHMDESADAGFEVRANGVLISGPRPRQDGMRSTGSTLNRHDRAFAQPIT
jgi:hypothetical protein